MSFLRNAWYAAAWAIDVKVGSLTAVTLLNEPLVLFRSGDNGVTALSGVCPHRFAPLSFGTIFEGAVQCGYHGLRFDRNGRCLGNAHSKVVSKAQLRVYPAVERHQLLWVWMGDPIAAAKQSIPDLSFIDKAPPETRARGYCKTQADYRLFVDNVMDLSHVDYLHKSAFNTDFLGGMSPEVQELGDTVRARWRAQNKRPMPPFGSFLPEGLTDNLLEIDWHPPAVMILFTGAVKAEGDIFNGVNATTAHVMSPESECSTHYFFCSVRNFAHEDVGFTRQLEQMLSHAFSEEDKPIIEAQQRLIGCKDLMDLHPALLASDAAAVRVRRVLARLVENERTALEAHT